MRHGFLLIRKPKGPTSHDIVGRVRRVLNERNVGHLGTLDPHATGLLVVAVGAKALKVVELFVGLPKSYRADVRFGAVSTTYDAEGVLQAVTARPGWDPPDESVLRRTIDQHFLGSIQQVPPAFSAVKVDGVRAHRSARAGHAPIIKPRTVEISRYAIERYAYPELTLSLDCSSGTYIRSLAHDLGQVLRCGAYLSDLERTRVGNWSDDASVAPEDATWTDVLPLKEVLKDLPSITVNDAEYEHLRHGRAIEREVGDGIIAWHADLPVAILLPLRDGSRGCRARKVF